MNKRFVLYHYWRSSCSWRVRLALNHKSIKPEYIHVNLLDDSTETEIYLNKSPLGYVPVLEVDGVNLIESVAILEWLDENFKQNPFYPGDSFKRAHIRSLVEVINADTQPLQNLTALDLYSSDEKKRNEWCKFFIRRGLNAFETKMALHAGKFSVGDEITAPDLFLIPQCYNAVRFGLSLDEFPRIKKIYEQTSEMENFKTAHPDRFKPEN